MFFEIKLLPPHGTIPTEISGVEVDVEIINMILVLKKEVIDNIISNFDQNSSASPSEEDCRLIARPILEAILNSRT